MVNCFECKHREVIRMLVGEEIAETDYCKLGRFDIFDKHPETCDCFEPVEDCDFFELLEKLEEVDS